MSIADQNLYVPLYVNSHDGVGLPGRAVFQQLTPDMLMRTYESAAQESAFSEAANDSLVLWSWEPLA